MRFKVKSEPDKEYVIIHKQTGQFLVYYDWSNETYDTEPIPSNEHSYYRKEYATGVLKRHKFLKKDFKVKVIHITKTTVYELED